MTREQRVIWAAGFIDGEGCVQLSRVRQKDLPGQWKYWMSLTATQNVEYPLILLRDLFGGQVAARRTGGFLWQITTRQAAAALQEMLPYLAVKDEQALVALSFQSRRRLGAPKGQRHGGHILSREQDVADWQHLRDLKARTAIRPRPLKVMA